MLFDHTMRPSWGPIDRWSWRGPAISFCLGAVLFVAAMFVTAFAPEDSSACREIPQLGNDSRVNTKSRVFNQGRPPPTQARHAGWHDGFSEFESTTTTQTQVLPQIEALARIERRPSFPISLIAWAVSVVVSLLGILIPDASTGRFFSALTRWHPAVICPPAALATFSVLRAVLLTVRRNNEMVDWALLSPSSRVVPISPLTLRGLVHARTYLSWLAPPYGGEMCAHHITAMARGCAAGAVSLAIMVVYAARHETTRSFSMQPCWHGTVESPPSQSFPVQWQFVRTGLSQGSVNAVAVVTLAVLSSLFLGAPQCLNVVSSRPLRAAAALLGLVALDTVFPVLLAAVAPSLSQLFDIRSSWVRASNGVQEAVAVGLFCLLLSALIIAAVVVAGLLFVALKEIVGLGFSRDWYDFDPSTRKAAGIASIVVSFILTPLIVAVASVPAAVLSLFLSLSIGAFFREAVTSTNNTLPPKVATNRIVAASLVRIFPRFCVALKKRAMRYDTSFATDTYTLLNDDDVVASSPDIKRQRWGVDTFFITALTTCRVEKWAGASRSALHFVDDPALCLHAVARFLGRNVNFVRCIYMPLFATAVLKTALALFVSVVVVAGAIHQTHDESAALTAPLQPWLPGRSCPVLNATVAEVVSGNVTFPADCIAADTLSVFAVLSPALIVFFASVLVVVQGVGPLSENVRDGERLSAVDNSVYLEDVWENSCLDAVALLQDAVPHSVVSNIVSADVIAAFLPTGVTGVRPRA